jgi:hypothetical protein
LWRKDHLLASPLWVEGQGEQAAVPEVVHVDVEVGEDVGRGVGQRVEDLDRAALLGHEDAPVSAEAHAVGWFRPLSATVSWNPLGRVVAAFADMKVPTEMTPLTTSSTKAIASARCRTNRSDRAREPVCR